jgi:hypothetical protein
MGTGWSGGMCKHVLSTDLHWGMSFALLELIYSMYFTRRSRTGHLYKSILTDSDTRFCDRFVSYERLCSQYFRSKRGVVTCRHRPLNAEILMFYTEWSVKAFGRAWGCDM